MILEENVREVLSRAKIEEVVSDYVALKKSGAAYKGLSPFSKEKTPSFYVLPGKQIFKDFSSGKGGDVVTFLREVEHFSFPEAIRFLAQRYQIPLQEKEDTFDVQQLEQKQYKESLFILSDFAQNFFQDQLWNTAKGQEIAGTYLQARGFSQAILRKFGVGFAGFQTDAFTRLALSQTYPLTLLLEAGLTKQKDDYNYDFFKERIIFPIYSVAGRILGFGGRTLKTDKHIPKYINSKESEVYKKSEILYGLFQAKNEIVKHNNTYLVEGYTDVMALHQAGLTNTIGTAGTALTQEQIYLLQRYTSCVTLVYDADQAGLNAAFRSIDLLLQAGLQVQIVTLPEDEDPDSFARKHQPLEVETYFQEKKEDFLYFKIRIIQNLISDPTEKAKKIKDLLQSILQIPDLMTRQMYLKECSQILDLSASFLEEVVQKNHGIIPKNHFFKKEKSLESLGTPHLVSTKKTYPAEEYAILQAMFLYGQESILVEREEEPIAMPLTAYLITEIQNDELNFDDLLFQKIYQVFLEKHLTHQVIDSTFFIHHPDFEIQKIAIDFLEDIVNKVSENWKKYQVYPHQIRHHIEEYTMWLVARFKYEKIKKKLPEKMEMLKKIQPEDEENLEKILKEIQNLNEIKKHFAQFLGIVADPVFR